MDHPTSLPWVELQGALLAPGCTRQPEAMAGERAMRVFFTSWKAFHRFLAPFDPVS